jgi:hypothetical protein
MIEEQNANDRVQPVRLSMEGAMESGPVDAFFRLDRWLWCGVANTGNSLFSAGRDTSDKFMTLFPVIGQNVETLGLKSLV